jgi:hypothetical protein
MHLFDSATAEMKRMRNQKKDGTALEKMKIRSTEIEPTEWIFNPNGDFRRARDIFDESTEDSPVSYYRSNCPPPLSTLLLPISIEDVCY